MKILVTGATGYIGSRLVQRALACGFEVISASRRPLSPQPRLTWMPYDLTSSLEIRFPDGIDAVFHLAATTSLNALDPVMELSAAHRVIHAAEKDGAKFIFASSQTACEKAPTAYGRTKWQIERLVLASGGWVIRPGQVYGGPERALFGTLVTVVRGLPVIPAFLPSPQIQPVHVDDLVAALLQCAESNNIPSSVLCIGSVEPVSFTDFLRAIARERVRRYRFPLPIPVMLVRLASVVLGECLRVRRGLDRLGSLFDLPQMETEHDLRLLGVVLRPLSSGMVRSGDARRRNLIREGQALLHYVLRARPSPALVMRYVRCIERLRDGQPLHLREPMLGIPPAIALLDGNAALSIPTEAEVAWRLNAAVVLAEASTQGARRFLAIGQTSGFVYNFMYASRAVVLELWWRSVRLVATPILSRRFRISSLL